MATPRDSGAEAPAAAEQVTFELERFAWAGPERLEVGGRWSGLGDEQLGSPVLTVELKDHALRLSPLALAPPRLGPHGEWSAAFFWPERRPMSLGPARLEFPTGLVVDLPQASSTRLRFRHRSAHVRMAEPPPAPGAGGGPAEGASATADGRGPVPRGAGGPTAGEERAATPAPVAGPGDVAAQTPAAADATGAAERSAGTPDATTTDDAGPSQPSAGTPGLP